MRTERNAIRVLTGLVLIVAFGLPALVSVPSSVVLLLASTVFVRGVVRGQVPTSASREAFEWSDQLVATTDEITAAPQAQIDSLDREVRLIAEFLRARGS